MLRKDIDRANEYLTSKVPSVMKNDLRRIILYGSCARGDFKEDSDIDIALLTGCGRMDAKKYDDKLMDVVTDIAMDTGAIVQYVCIPEDEFEEKKSWYGYFRNINREGIVLYG